MKGQVSFTETMYIYECPRCEARHWDTENLEEKEGTLSMFCTLCETPEGEAYEMPVVDEFEFNRFAFEPPERLPV